MIVVDTNVVSELMRAEPAGRVVAWLRRHRAEGLFTTAITVAEIGHGIERLPEGERKRLLRPAARQLFSSFARQVLPFDAASADEYAEVVTVRERAGRPIDGFDAQIAAICRVHDAVLATRNGRDFEGVALHVVNPWT